MILQMCTLKCVLVPLGHEHSAVMSIRTLKRKEKPIKQKNKHTIVEALAEFVQKEMAMNKCQDIDDYTCNKEDGCYHKT